MTPKIMIPLKLESLETPEANLFFLRTFLGLSTDHPSKTFLSRSRDSLRKSELQAGQVSGTTHELGCLGKKRKNLSTDFSLTFGCEKEKNV